MLRLLSVLAVALTCLFCPPEVVAQSAKTWCQDTATVCWDETTPASFIGGLRLVAEPQLGFIMQSGNNKFEQKQIEDLSKFGIETNLVGGWVSFQALFIPPTSVEYNPKSPLRRDGHLADQNGRVAVENGWTIGLSFLDGSIAVGWGTVHYDENDFVDPQALRLVNESAFSDGFWYLNLQAFSALRNRIKERKD